MNVIFYFFVVFPAENDTSQYHWSSSVGENILFQSARENINVEEERTRRFEEREENKYTSFRHGDEVVVEKFCVIVGE